MRPELGGLRILVVEGDAETRLGFKAFLANMSRVLSVVARAEEAVSELQRQPWDVLICDVELPHLAGWRLLLGHHGWPEPKWKISITTDPGETALAESKRYGAVAHLVKPFEPKALDSILRRLSEHAPGTAS